MRLTLKNSGTTMSNKAMLRNYINEIRQGNVSAEEALKKAITSAQSLNKKFHFFTTPTYDLAAKQAHDIQHMVQNHREPGTLAGVAVSVKDALCISGIESCAGSAILKGYKPLITATAVTKTINAGGCIIGKTAQDEFGFGGFSVNVGHEFPVPLNPHDTTRSCGGSSGGAACLTAAADFPHVAIAESTGGSIVNPAAFCGVVGLCPTYGRVSRFGLIDYANSLDKIGPVGKNVEDVALALSVMAGHDQNDATSSTLPVEDYAKHATANKIRVGVIKESFGEGSDEAVRENVRAAINKLADAGCKITEVTLPTTYTYGIPSYYLIAMSEASTNLSRYAGILYGASEPLAGGFRDYFSAVRTKHFGTEAKRRILLGTFARMTGWRDQYYTKALQVRQLIIKEYQHAFSTVDVLATPTMPFIAPKFSEIKDMTPLQNYMTDILTVGPNLAGLPHLSVPCAQAKGMPVGLLLTAPHFREDLLFHIGVMHEQA
ncbi:Asp-tRNA(Asn)/Glu-tRNA(Gln) amidotransferase subunit GatA [Candidatus Woesearchaeota archaeon]|nr:Asp-tRNA(Asn)/Glu-tRNA(Gln) amidotransferase subunit GatA [Candidatus Woesearchaeota archaeon]